AIPRFRSTTKVGTPIPRLTWLRTDTSFLTCCHRQKRHVASDKRLQVASGFTYPIGSLVLLGSEIIHDCRSSRSIRTGPLRTSSSSSFRISSSRSSLKSFSPKLAAGKGGVSLFQEMRDAFLEISGAEARFHLFGREIEGLAEIL